METQFSKPNIFTPVIDAIPHAEIAVFHDIQFPIRHSKQGQSTAYRVYRSKDKNDFIEVEGQAAYDVLAKCGVNKPYRVIKAKSEVSTILSLNELTIPEHSVELPKPSDLNAIIEPPATGEAQAAEAAPAAEATETPAEEAPKAE